MPTLGDVTEQSPSPAGRRLALLALVVLALNMRPAAVSVGPVLAEVRDGLEMSTTVAGVLTSLPVVLFALVGAVAPWLSRTVGIHRTILASLLALHAGLALCSMVTSPLTFLVLSHFGCASLWDHLCL